MTTFLTIRSYVSKREHDAMCVCRTEGATLPFISRIFSRNLETVYRHTFHVPHANRMDRTIHTNSRTGKRFVAKAKGFSVAGAKVAAGMRSNRIKVRGVVKA